jgi:hypothetical protein
MPAFVLSSPSSIIESRFARRAPLQRALLFVDALAAVPASSWVDIGRSLLADHEGLPNRVTAWAALNAIIADRQLRIATWYVRDALKTGVFLARRSGRLHSLADRRAFYAACDAAEDCALAYLALPRLAAADFDALCRPFAQHVRVGLLGGKQVSRVRQATRAGAARTK